LVGHVDGPGDLLDLVEGADLGAEAAVHAQNLLVDEGHNRQTVEALGEGLPQLDAKSSFALVVKAVYSVDRGRLVIASQQEEVLGVFDFIGQQQTDGLETLLASVNIIPQEQVVRVGWVLAILEQSQQVVVLAMHVA
jgi:hypothetical protein